MNSEDELFDKLRRTPFNEMYILYNEWFASNKSSLGFSTNFLEKEKEFLEQHYWTTKEFITVLGVKLGT